MPTMEGKTIAQYSVDVCVCKTNRVCLYGIVANATANIVTQNTAAPNHRTILVYATICNNTYVYLRIMYYFHLLLYG